MNIELACSGFELVSLRSRASLSDNFIDAFLNHCARQVLNLEQVRHEAHQGLLWGRDKVLVPHNVQRLLFLLDAVTKQHFEEFLHLAALSLDEIVPPLGVIQCKVIVWLVTVADRVTERSKGRENVKRVPDANERLVGRVGSASFDTERMVRLGDPNTVITVTLSLQTHDLQRSGRVDADR